MSDNFPIVVNTDDELSTDGYDLPLNLIIMTEGQIFLQRGDVERVIFESTNPDHPNLVFVNSTGTTTFEVNYADIFLAGYHDFPVGSIEIQYADGRTEVLKPGEKRLLDGTYIMRLMN